MNEESLFHEALARTNPRERANYLAKACAGQPALRAAVEELLSAHDQSGQFLQTPAVVAVIEEAAEAPLREGVAGPTQETENRAGLTDPDSRRIGQETLDVVQADPDRRPATRETLDFIQPENAAPAPEEKIPDRIGRYHIKKLLGRGGMGTVYLAYDPELDRPVALKVPKLSGLDAEERFLREARAAAALSHPNLCPVHDAGRADGVLYLAMAFVPGPTLTDVIRQQGPLEPSRAAAIAVGVARGIAEAHRHGVVHRDLKPGNILLSRQGEPIVTDFGLALRAAVPDVPLEGAASAGHDPRLTLAGVLMGTPAYVPPEQARGDLARIGPASDVYALGAILFELLTGRQPFEAPSVHELVRQIETKPTPSLAGIRPGIPGGLEAVCRRALAKNPGERFASMEAFAGALAPFAKEQKHRYWRGIAITAAAAFILILAGGIVFYVQTHNGTIEIRLNDPTANVEVTVDGEEIKLTENGRITRLRAGEHALIVKGPDYETETRLFKVKRGLSDVIEVELKPKAVAGGKPSSAPGLDFATQARLANILARGRQLVEGGHYGDLKRVFEEALSIDPESPGALALRATFRNGPGQDRSGARADAEAALKLNPELRQALLIRAAVNGQEGRLDEAIADASVAIRLNPKHEAGWATRAFSYLRKKDYYQAIADAQRAIELGGSRLDAFTTRAIAQVHLGEFAKALADYEVACERSPTSAFLFLERSAIHAKLGNVDKAGADRVTARILDPRLDDSPIALPDPPPPVERKKLTPEESSQLATALSTAQRAWDMVQVGACARALAEALRIDPTSATAWSLKARLSTLNGSRADAIAEATEAIRLDPSDVWAYVARGAAREKAGELAAAIADNVVALRLDPKHHWCWNNRGYAYVRRGQFHQGLADLNEAVRLQPDYAEGLTNRGQCLLHLGDLTSALADYAKAAELQPAVGRWRLICAAIRAGQNDLAGARRDRERALALDPQLANADGITLPVPLPPVKKDPELTGAATPETSPPPIDKARLASLLAHGRKLIDEGRYDRLKPIYEEALRMDPESPGGLALRATFRHVTAGDRQGARADAEAALRLNPDTFQALMQRSALIGPEGKIDDAIADLTIANRLQPKHPSPLASRAYGYVFKKEYRQAIADATRAIELGFMRPDALQARSGAYVNLGEYAKALADYDVLALRTPSNPTVFVQRSAVHALLGNTEKAAADWATAQKLNPNLTDNDRMAVPDPPKPPERKQLTPDEAARLAAALKAAQTAFGHGRNEDCAKAIDEACTIDPTCAAARSLRARVLGDTGRSEEEIAEATEAIRLNPDDPWAYTARGNGRNRLKDHAGAVADHVVAIRLDPTNYVPWNNRGHAYCLRGQPHQGLADLNECLRLRPNYGKGYGNRGACYVQLGEYEKALADYLKAAEAQPSNVQWRRFCAALYARLGMFEEASKQRDIVVRMDAQFQGAPDVKLPVPLPVKKDPE